MQNVSGWLDGLPMGHDEMKEHTGADNFWHSINWLWVALAFTAAYLIFMLAWLGPHKIISFTKTDELNAIGDFLAGVFSPLAFIWLVAAVLTQRQELTDTRDQFAENQKVVDAQLKTINEQSDLLQQQHNLAEETARKTYRLSLFEQRFAIYNEILKVGKEAGYHNPLRLEEYFEMRQVAAKCGFVFDETIESYIDGTVDAYETYLENLAEWKSTWNSDNIFNRGIKPDTPKSREIEAALSVDRDAILSSLSLELIRGMMWKSLRVTEE